MEQHDKLEGKRLFLRNQTAEDIERACLYSGDPELAAVDPVIGESLNPVYYSIITNEGVHIGFTATYNFSGIDVELGIRIWNRDYWDKGYGTEALNLLADWVFKSSLVNTILVKMVESNARARKCYEKCGFTEYARGPMGGRDMVWMQKVRENVGEGNIQR